MKLFKWLYKTRTAKQNNNSNLENNSSKVIDKIPKVKNKTQDLWNVWNFEYQRYVTITSIKLEEINGVNKRAVVYLKDLEKRKEAYGICGECYRPGTGWHWCQPCNAKRFKENFNKWTSGNKNVDELIQESQLNAIHYSKCLEWIPFEQFSTVSYITRGGFSKIYKAYWSDGNIEFWDINRQGWHRNIDQTVVLKSLDNLSDICKDSLNEIKSHLQIYLWCIVPCYGLTQDPIIGDYMMVLKYCKGGNLQNFIQSKNTLYYDKIYGLSQIARGLYDIHNVGKVHKDFHSGNILFNSIPYISDLGMCQPVNESKQSEGIYGVLPYIAPEVLRGYQYVKASDIYSFGIVMNEYLSEKIPYCNVPHDDILAVKICKGLRPKIANETPNLLSDLIKKCLDAKVGNRPTAKELYQTLEKLSNEQLNPNSDIYAQIEECKRIRANMFQNESNESQPKSIQTHSQAIYTSRLLNFKNLPDPVNSYPCKICTVSECLDTQISEDISF